MPLLEQLILHLSPAERKSFRATMKGKSATDKAGKLFDMIASGREWKEGEICFKLYKEPASRSYHSLRNRLSDAIIEFLKDDWKDRDETGKAHTKSLIYVAEMMTQRKAFEAAEHLLSRAEAMAREAHQYSLLLLCLNIRLSHSDELVNDMTQIQEDVYRALELSQLSTLLNMELAKVREQSKLLRIKGAHFDAQESINTIRTKLESLHPSSRTNPEFLLRLLTLFRTLLLSSKEYVSFKISLIDIYQDLSSAKVFDGLNKPLHREYLYMLAHAHYRTRELKSAREYVEKLLREIHEEQQEIHPLYIKAVSLQAGISFYSGQLDVASDHLANYLSGHNGLHHKERLNMQINLAVYYFFQKRYREAMQMLLKLPHRNKALEMTKGKEWFFKKDLIEVIFQYELEKIDIAEQRLNAVLKNYEELFLQPVYERVKTFIGFIQEFFATPEVVRTEAFHQKVINARIRLEGQSEDIQAILFFCWLRSKMQQRDCYEVVLERVAEEGEF
jgi:hypothetical protein